MAELKRLPHFKELFRSEAFRIAKSIMALALPDMLDEPPPNPPKREPPALNNPPTPPREANGWHNLYKRKLAIDFLLEHHNKVATLTKIEEELKMDEKQFNEKYKEEQDDG